MSLRAYRRAKDAHEQLGQITDFKQREEARDKLRGPDGALPPLLERVAANEKRAVAEWNATHPPQPKPRVKRQPKS
jgi:hypothetical protein